MRRKPPFWFCLIVAVAVLPSFLFPTFFAIGGETKAAIDEFILYGFPIYLIVSALLAYLCYAERRVLSWILTAVMYLTDIAMYLLLTV